MRKIAAICLSIFVAAWVSIPAQAQMMRDKFNILMLTDLSSTYAETSGPGDVEAVKLAIEEFEGKINNIPINLIVIDNKLDPALSVNKARELIDKEGLSLITDVSSSAAAIAIAKLAKEKKVLTTFVSPGTLVLTNEECSQYTWHVAWNTNAMAVPARTLIQGGAKKWYFITADFAFGKSLLDSFTRMVETNGGEIIGGDLVPFPSDDFSSFLLKAKGAGAQAIGLLSSGEDLRNAAKQAHEFGLLDAGIKIVPGQLNLSDVKSTGPEVWAGSLAGLSWYWDMDDEARKFAQRFHKDLGFYPGDIHAGNYSAVLQILKTVQKIGTDDPVKVSAALEGMTSSDMFARNAVWRKKDHMVLHDF
jgi:branched-chain amino acid transport system substrate-binding protein